MIPRLPRNAIAAPLVAGVTAFALVAAALLFHVSQEQSRYESSVRATVIGEASGLRAELERAVDARVSLLDGLSGYAVAQVGDEDLDEDQFERFADRLVESAGVPIRSIQLAPDAVVTYVHPVEGNEAAIGHDLLADEDRRAAVLETIEARAAVVAGPLELLQGGTAIIVRSPLFLERDGVETWWGLATVVADFPPIVEESGLAEVGEDREVAVRFVEGRRNDFGSEVFGELALFERDPVTFDVTLPSGRWELGLLPAGGWDAVVWPRFTTTLIGGLLFAVLIGLLVGRLVASQRRFRRASADLVQLFDTASVPIVRLDLERTIRGWNREAEEITGVSEAEALGRPLADVAGLVPPSEHLLVEVIDDVIERGEARHGVEVTFVAARGPRTLLVNVSPQRDSVGRVVGAVAVAQDISDRLEAEQVRAENVAMSRTARLKDEFLAGMSHELRTPLNGVIGLSSILEKRTFGELNEKQAEYVSQIRRSGRHLLSLINDVLDLARIEAAREELQLSAVAVPQIAGEALALVGEMANEKGQRVVADLPDGLPMIVADPRRLTQVLVNLLANAVKFTPEGGTVGLTVRAGSGLELTVWDTGIGIAPEKQGLLFQPFQQIDAALDRSYGGTGLGLSLTQRLVSLHGGRLTVESSEGEGARFTVTLPLRATGSAGTDESAPESVPAVAAPSVLEAPLRVVLADDYDLNRRLVSDFLSAEGIEVSCATNGEEAIELVRSTLPDVVLMDIQMPVKDGLQATRELKGSTETERVPVIALTALAMEGDAERCLGAGCDAYLSKPIDPAEVLSLVRELGGRVGAR